MMNFLIPSKNDYTVLYFFSARLLRGLSAVMAVICFFAFFTASRSGTILKLAQCLALFLLSFLPRLFKMQAYSGAIWFCWFLIFAGLFGSVAELYSAIPFFDVLTHLLSGVVCVVVFRDLCIKQNIFLPGKLLIISALGFTLAAACVWEMYEFVAFSVFKNTPLSLHALAGEFGFSAAAKAVNATLHKNSIVSAGTVEALLKNEYDTFCDILCALLAAAPSLVWMMRRKKQKAQ